MQAHELGGRLMTLNVLRRGLTQSAAPDIPLHHTQLPVLETILRIPDSNQAMLAERLHVTPASIALSTKRLEKAGLIERRVDPDNRRCNQLRATEAGKRAAAAYRCIFHQVDQKTFACLTLEECAQLGALFDRMIQHITGSDRVSLIPFLTEELDT